MLQSNFSCHGSQEIAAVARFLRSCPNVAFRRACYTVSRGGGRTMGSFEAILLVASSSAALFWLAVRMA